MESEEKTEAEKLGITEDQLKEYREAFNIFDSDGDKVISKEELMTVVKTLGYNPSKEEITKMIADVDQNDNGQVEFEEFVQLMQQRMKSCYTEEIIKEAFDVMDKDGEGYITLPRLKQLIEDMGLSMTADEINEMMDEADPGGTGMVKYEDLIDLLSEENESLYEAYKRNELIRKRREEAKDNQKDPEEGTSAQENELQQDTESKPSEEQGKQTTGTDHDANKCESNVPDIKDISSQYGRSKYDKFSRQPAKDVKVVKLPGQKVPISRTRMAYLQRRNKALGHEGSTISTDQSQEFNTQNLGHIRQRRNEPWLGSIHDNDAEFDRSFKASSKKQYKNVTSRIMDEKYFTKTQITKTPRQTREVLHQKSVVVNISSELEKIGIGPEKKNIKQDKQRTEKVIPSQKHKKTSEHTSQTKPSKGKLAIKGSEILLTETQVQNNKQTTVSGVTTDKANHMGYAEMRNIKTKERLYYAVWRTAFVEAMKKIAEKEEREMNEKLSNITKSIRSESKLTVRASVLTPTLETPLPRNTITDQHAGSYADHYRKVHNLSAPEPLMQPTKKRKPYVPEARPVKITRNQINAMAGLYTARF